MIPFISIPNHLLSTLKFVHISPVTGTLATANPMSTLI
jgi:hypothetical protein